MSESPPTKDVSSDKETATEKYASAHSDPEAGDHGILVKAAPLARDLKGRHMQMIAIGKVHQLST
jgi:amino acid transporter